MNIFDFLADHLVTLTIGFLIFVVIYRWYERSSRSSNSSNGSTHSKPKPNVDMVKVQVGVESDLKDGQMKEVKLEKDLGTILLFREKDNFFATGSKCTHVGAPLVKGAFVNGRVRCPWHGACFSAETGDIEEMPGVDNLQSFKVTKEGNKLFINADKSALKDNWKRANSVCKRGKDDKVFAVVGAGAAGFSCVEHLRKEGYRGRIVLFGQEKHHPYDRTKLSKSLSLTVDKIYYKPPSFYEEADIETQFGVDVEQIDIGKKLIKLSDKSVHKFDKVLIATGAKPRTLNCEGKYLKNIYCLRVPEQAHEIVQSMKKDIHVVIVGSSFIGMECAASLSQMPGKVPASVTVIGMEKVPFERVLGTEVGASLQYLHEQKKVQFRMEKTVERFRGDEHGNVSTVVLNDGEELPCSIVIMGAGVIPSTSFVSEGLKKERDGSIYADEFLCAAKDVYVAGDICRYPYHKLKGQSVRIEHLGLAMYQGKIAALNMLDKNVKCSSIPFFWTSQFGKSVRYCGHAFKYDQIIFDGDVNKLQFIAFYCLENEVLAACSVGRDPVCSIIAELLHNNVMPSVQDILKEQKNGKITLGGKI